MWIVRNLLRGTLTFRGLGVSIAAKAEFDLDTLGRERAEQSNQVQVAFEEGYLVTVRKHDGVSVGDHDGASAAVIDERLAGFKESMKAELNALRTSVVGDVREVLGGLKVAKLKLNDEKRRVLIDDSLSQAEVRARLAYLEEQERDLTSHFSSIGRKEDVAAAGVVAKADLLSSI